ncbi:MAG: hypothetical protein ACRCWO_06485 [Bosea sp. (in: a-proteobacteria)]
MSTFPLGRLIGIAFAVFAIVALIASYDMARGRNPETQSALVLDVLSGGAAKQCKRDVSNVVLRHIKPGMSADEAKRAIAAASITPPSPWFWRSSLIQSLNETPASIQAVRTLRATVFGNELLRLDIALSDGKVSAVTGRVECAFG